ncbi:MAG: imidazole glycerol phosphate synthase subunit HisH [Clostridia bacterium]|nr:imidazole glycerol phosphate synthase subunit HisH [Lachnospiraceae bacterium]MBR0437552.1 imidazole glycerol phosphate synthase subunit HisH [Clostridia bacterium]
MTAIVDYGVGNLFSLQSSLDAIGEESIITGKREELEKADRIILPGVGAFGDVADKLRETGLDTVVKELAKEGKSILGICLGMQLLFEKSYEFGEHEGLGLLKGSIVMIDVPDTEKYKLPQMGWNSLHIKREHPLLRYVSEGDFVYFVHSFMASDCEDSIIAVTEYGTEVTAAVAKDNVWGTQFHPEKSGNIGLNILRAFTGR